MEAKGFCVLKPASPTKLNRVICNNTRLEFVTIIPSEKFPLAIPGGERLDAGEISMRRRFANPESFHDPNTELLS